MTGVTRLDRKIEPEPNSGCWLWVGAWGGSKRERGYYGYTSIPITNVQVPVHRVVYELLRGPIPEGLTLDHLCRNRVCVNPAHLEPVAGKENNLRGTSPWADHARMTHCPHGHPYDTANTRVTGGQRPGRRICLACVRARDREVKRRKRAMGAP